MIENDSIVSVLQKILVPVVSSRVSTVHKCAATGQDALTRVRAPCGQKGSLHSCQRLLASLAYPIFVQGLTRGVEH